MRSLDLPEQEWREVVMPGSTTPARLATLQADAATGASLSLVRFPPGWVRTESGHYAVAEELYVLEGAVDVAGPVAAGEYCFLPPRTTRERTATQTGALVLAWFSGPPVWVPGEADVPPLAEPVVRPAQGVLREPGAELAGGYAVRRVGPGETLDADADVLDPVARTWAWVPAGTALPEGELHLRTWA